MAFVCMGYIISDALQLFENNDAPCLPKHLFEFMKRYRASLDGDDDDVGTISEKATEKGYREMFVNFIRNILIICSNFWAVVAELEMTKDTSFCGAILNTISDMELAMMLKRSETVIDTELKPFMINCSAYKH